MNRQEIMEMIGRYGDECAAGGRVSTSQEEMYQLIKSAVDDHWAEPTIEPGHITQDMVGILGDWVWQPDIAPSRLRDEAEYLAKAIVIKYEQRRAMRECGHRGVGKTYCIRPAGHPTKLSHVYGSVRPGMENA